MKWITRVLKLGLGILTVGALFGVGAIATVYLYLEPKLPSTENLREVRLQVPLRVYGRDHKLIAEFGEKRRIPLALHEIPEQLIQAFLAAEDDRYFEHPGVDYRGLLRAATQLVLTGERRQGGSTITMQVARNFFLSPEKTFIRKLNEILLALRIEQELSKSEILELYLNKIFLGHRAYGVGAAAQVYYGLAVDELSPAQAAMIAGLPKAPSRFNPIADPDRALLRRDYVLERMLKLGFITTEAFSEANALPVTAMLHAASTEVEAPYVAEMARADLVERFGTDVYTDGYSAFTSIDSRLQASANRALRKALQEYDKRHGYRGAERNHSLDQYDSEIAWDGLLAGEQVIGGLRAALVTEVEQDAVNVYLGRGKRLRIDWNGLEWAKPYETEDRRGAQPKRAGDILKPGDLVRVLQETDKEGKAYWRLAQIPAVEGAFLSLDPKDGAILALVGGYNFYSSKFNRATQAKRQPGSGFKAFIYSAALEADFNAASLINDAPVVFEDPSLEGAWRPQNYSGKFFGPTRLRLALTKSRNLVSIRLLRAMGVDHALKHASRFGFDPTSLPRNLSLALGTGSVTLLEMAEGYAVLANGGYRIEPYFIDRIERNREGKVYETSPLRVCRDCEINSPAQLEAYSSTDLVSKSVEEEGIPHAPRVISPQNSYLMNSMMKDVIQFGTGKRARILGRRDLAGKTGTTNDHRDAWFNGFNGSLVAIAWVGFDSSEPLGHGETGGRAALPAWIEFMRETLKDVPEQPVKMPSNMVTVRIDPHTGARASIDQKDAIFEVFRTEHAPQALARNDRGKMQVPTAAYSTPDDSEDPF